MTTPHADKGDRPLQWAGRTRLAATACCVGPVQHTASGCDAHHGSTSTASHVCLHQPPRETRQPSASAPKTGAASDTRMSCCLCALLRRASATVWPDADSCLFRKHVPAAEGSKASLRKHRSFLHTTNSRVSHLHRRLSNFWQDPFSRNLLVATDTTLGPRTGRTVPW